MLTFSNITSDSFEVDSRAGRKRPRHRQAICCRHCRSRKIKCDKSQPCKPCVDRGAPLDCVYKVSKDLSKPSNQLSTVSVPDADSLAHQNRTSPLAPTSWAKPPSVGGSSSNTDVGCSDHGPDSISSTPAGDCQDRQAFPGQRGTFKGKGSKTSLAEGTQWKAVCKDLTVTQALLDKDAAFESSHAAFKDLKTRIREANDVPDSISITSVTAVDLRNLLPSRPACDKWIKKYQNTYGRIYNVIDGEDLQKALCGAYESTVSTKKSIVHVSELCMIVALAMQTEDTDRLDGRRIAKCVESCYYSSTRFQKPCIGIVRTLLLLIIMKTIYSSDTEKETSALGLFGLTNQIAFGMGLHRDPALFPSVTPRDAGIRSSLWACLLRLNLDWCVKTGRQLLFRVEDCDCPLPSYSSYSEYRDLTSTPAQDGDGLTPFHIESDFAFSSIAAKLAQVTAVTHQSICSPNTMITTALQEALQEKFEQLLLEMPSTLKGEHLNGIEQLQQAFIVIGMQRFKLLISLYLSNGIAPGPLLRGHLLDVWHSSISTIHQLTDLCRRGADTHVMAYQFLWSDVCRAAFSASLVLGRLRNMESKSIISAQPPQALSPFQQALIQEFTLLSKLWLSKCHLGPVAAKTYLLLATTEAVTINLFTEPNRTRSAQTLLYIGALAAEHGVMTMKQVIQQRLSPQRTSIVGFSGATNAPEDGMQSSSSSRSSTASLSTWTEKSAVDDIDQGNLSLNHVGLHPSIGDDYINNSSPPLTVDNVFPSLLTTYYAPSSNITKTANSFDFDFNAIVDFDFNSTLLQYPEDDLNDFWMSR